MMSSMMRSTMKKAVRRPVSLTRRMPSCTSVRSPGVKNRFKTAVKRMMNSTGRSPRTMALTRTQEMRTQTARHRAMMP